MNWQKSMNQAIDYIENHLSENTNYSELANIALCSESEFRRMFSLFASVPVSDYIRYRRLTLAAKDIREGEKIIDVALKYKYDSQAAFSRAFKKFHKIAPSFVQKSDVTLRYYPRLKFKILRVDKMESQDKAAYRTNIIGAGEVNYAVSITYEQDEIHKVNKMFWNDKGNDILNTLSLPKWGAFLSEEKCRLFGDVSGKRMLEICCGTGQSLKYHWKRKAAELWGIDLSQKQLNDAEKLLDTCGASANLICTPMEAECGIPKNYFDYVYSVYGIGWTTDLDGTFQKIASYLKGDGIFIFSWSHPIHKCVAYESGELKFIKSYFDESWYSVNLDDKDICLADRKLSTYINSLVKAGFMIEQLVEESDKNLIKSSQDDFSKKAKMLPATFVIKARKIRG